MSKEWERCLIGATIGWPRSTWKVKYWKYYPRCQKRKSILVKLMLLVKICETETAWIKSFSKERGCCYQSNSLIIEKMFTAQYKNYLIKMLLVLMYSKGIPKIFYSYTDVKPNKCIEWLVTIKCYQPGGKRVGYFCFKWFN